jgi:hypothetical protein
MLIGKRLVFIYLSRSMKSKIILRCTERSFLYREEKNLHPLERPMCCLGGGGGKTSRISPNDFIVDT